MQRIPARRAVAVRLQRGQRVEVVNRRRPILTLVEDTSGGVHDTLLAACDRYRYELLGATEPHDNCTDNLHAVLASEGIAIAE